MSWPQSWGLRASRGGLPALVPARTTTSPKDCATLFIWAAWEGALLFTIKMFLPHTRLGCL